ncbi:MAG: hypothetical protein R3C25_10505 [Hyphomonadaceae bacterium]
MQRTSSLQANTPKDWRRSGQGRAGRRVCVFAAILAVILQALIVQSHVDLGPWVPGVASAATQLAQTTPEPAHNGGLGGAEGGCILCQAAALGAGMVLGASPVLPIAHSFALDAAAPAPAAYVATRRSHAWRSRAPPALL